MLASRSILHPVHEVELGVNRDGDLHLGYGKRFARSTRYLGAVLGVGGDGSYDALALEDSQHTVNHLM